MRAMDRIVNPISLSPLQAARRRQPSSTGDIFSMTMASSPQPDGDGGAIIEFSAVARPLHEPSVPQGQRHGDARNDVAQKCEERRSRLRHRQW